MKRSTMITLIQAYLDDADYMYRMANSDKKVVSIRLSEEYAKYLARHVLTEIEDAGMLPPLNELVYNHMDNEDRRQVNAARDYFIWENE